LESDFAGRPVRVADVLHGKLRSYQAPLDERFGFAAS
jgi:hypothetical protein